MLEIYKYYLCIIYLSYVFYHLPILTAMNISEGSYSLVNSCTPLQMSDHKYWVKKPISFLSYNSRPRLKPKFNKKYIFWLKSPMFFMNDFFEMTINVYMLE